MTALQVLRVKLLSARLMLDIARERRDVAEERRALAALQIAHLVAVGVHLEPDDKPVQEFREREAAVEVARANVSDLLDDVETLKARVSEAERAASTRVWEQS